MIIIMIQTRSNFYFSFTVIVSQNEYLENCAFTEGKKNNMKIDLEIKKNTAFPLV